MYFDVTPKSAILWVGTAEFEKYWGLEVGVT